MLGNFYISDGKVSNDKFNKIDIKSGDNLEKLLLKLQERSCLIDEKCHDLSCLFESSCDCVPSEGGKVSSKKAIDCIIKFLNNIDASKIILKSSDVDNSLVSGFSSYAGDLSGKYIPYDFIVSDKAASFSYNLHKLDLPECYSISKINVTAYQVNGKGKRTVIRSTDQSTYSIPIPFEKLPVVVDFDISIVSSEGKFSLRSQENLMSAVTQQGNVDFYVVDLSNKKNLCGEDGGIRLFDLLNTISSKLKVIMNTFRSWTNFKISGYDNVGVLAILGQLAAENKALCDKVDELTDKIEECNCGSESNCD